MEVVNQKARLERWVISWSNALGPHGLSTERFPESAYVGSSKKLKELKDLPGSRLVAPKPPQGVLVRGQAGLAINQFSSTCLGVDALLEACHRATSLETLRNFAPHTRVALDGCGQPKKRLKGGRVSNQVHLPGSRRAS